MIKRFNTTCRACKQPDKPVQYYISEWQKAYKIPLPFPYCEECAQYKSGLTRYQEWITCNGMIDKSLRNNTALS